MPRIIYSLWLQGKAAAPALVRQNWACWEALNPECRLVVLERADLDELLKDFPDTWRALPPQALSDIVRINLLARAGGIWTDASVMPARPLGGWLPEALAAGDFFAYALEGHARPLSSWFLAARPGAPIVARWHAAVRAYWAHEHVPLSGHPDYFIPEDPTAFMGLDRKVPAREYPYFWFHHIFGHLLRTDPDFAALWAACQRRSAEPPHRLQTFMRSHEGAFAEPASLRELLAFRRRRKLARELARIFASSEMHKLDWRAAYPLQRLLRLARRQFPARP